MLKEPIHKVLIGLLKYELIFRTGRVVMFGILRKKYKGCLDFPSEGQKTLFRVHINGWVVPPDDFCSIQVDTNTPNACHIEIGSDKRPDLAIHFPRVQNAENGGFKGVIPLGEEEGPIVLMVYAVTHRGERAFLGKRTVFNTRSLIFEKPEFFQLGLTTQCNLSCKMCPAHSASSKWIGQGLRFNPQLLERAYEALRYCGDNIKRVFLNDFGEPFLYTDIFDVIQEVHRICPRAKLSLTTNGTLFSEHIINRILQSNLSEIAVSLDAGSEKTFQEIRKGADYHKVTKGIQQYVETRRRSGKKSPIIHTNFVLMRSNIQELPEYVRLATSLGVDHIQTVNPFGIFEGDFRERLYKMPGDNCSPHVEKYTDILKEAQGIAKNAGISFSLPPFYPSTPGTDCRARGRTRVYLSPSGNIYPCCIMAAKGPEENSNALVLGNIMQKSLHEIWNSDPRAQYREAFFKGDPPIEYCLRCSRYYDL